MPKKGFQFPLENDHAAIERLDRNFLRMRRMMVKPAATTLPMAATGDKVDIAKVMACMAIADATIETQPDADPTTIKQVATALELDHSTASRLLTEAEAEGLVLRGTDPTDRRRTVVELTDTGRAVVAESAAMRLWVLDQVLADWNRADVDTLADLIERITDSLTHRLPEVMCAAQVHSGCGPDSNVNE
ncbi:MAG: MarR family winged helix-turn-helix transcriptional regulator [Candidatus Nanopelagicales bacterium]